MSSEEHGARDLVTIASYEFPWMAHVAVGKLENEGIESWLQDETTVGMFWSLGNAIGGIKLQVRGQEAMQAQSILAESSDPISTAPSPSGAAPTGPDQPAAEPTKRRRRLGAARLTAHRDKVPLHGQKTRIQRQCPDCGSADLRPLPGNSLFDRIRAFLRGHPLPLQCKNCGSCGPPAGLSGSFPPPGPID